MDEADVADSDPIPIHVSMNVQTPDFTDYLTEERVNKWLGWIRNARINYTEPIESVSLEVSKYTMMGCAAATMGTYAQAAFSGAGAMTTSSVKQAMYATCDRIACPYVPKTCGNLDDVIKPNLNGLLDGFGGDQYQLYFFARGEDKKFNIDDALFSRSCSNACKDTQSCVIRVTKTPNLFSSDGFESDTEGFMRKCVDVKNFDEFKQNIKDGKGAIATTCYTAGQPFYHQYTCLRNLYSGDNPKVSGINPADNIFTSFECGCFSGFYQHMRNINILLTSVERCLEGINQGEFEAGYCRELMSQYACDWMYTAIKRFRETGSVVPNGDGKRTEPAYPLENLQSVNTDLKNRYQDTVVDPRNGFNRKGVAYAACMAAFGADWNLFDAAMEDIVKEKQVEPMIPPPHGYSRLLAPNYLTGQLTIYYNVNIGIFSGGQDIEYEILFYCDKTKEGGQFCNAGFQGFANPIYRETDVVLKGMEKQDTVEITLPTTSWPSKGWANVVRLKAKYMVDGEQRTKIYDRPISHYGELPFGCNFLGDVETVSNASSAFRCTMLGDSPIGGTIQMRKLAMSPLTGEISNPKFYPGDEVNAKFSFSNNMYMPDNFVIKYRLVGPPGFNTIEGSSVSVVVDIAKYLGSGEQDVNLHLFSLIPDKINDYTPISYQEGYSPYIGTGTADGVSVIRKNLADLKTKMSMPGYPEKDVFYVKAGSNDVKSVSITFGGDLSRTIEKITFSSDDKKTLNDLNTFIFNKISETQEISSHVKTPISVSVIKNSKTEIISYAFDSATKKYIVGDDGALIINKNVDLVDQFVFYKTTKNCEKNSDNYFKCNITEFASKEITQIDLEVKTVASQKVTVTVTGDIKIPTENLLLSFEYNVGNTGNLPGEYKPGSYTLTTALYRGLNGVEDSNILLPYGNSNQTEVRTFTLIAAGTDKNPTLDVVFPPTTSTMSCSKAKDLVLAFNLNNWNQESYDYSVAISSSGSKVFKGTLKKENIKIDPKPFTVSYGNYIIKVGDKAFNDVVSNSQTGSVQIILKILDKDKNTVVTKSFNVNVVTQSGNGYGGFDCSLGLAANDISSTATYDSTASTAKVDAGASCLDGFGWTTQAKTSEPEKFTVDVCGISGNTLGAICENGKQCFVATCDPDNKGYKLKNLASCQQLGTEYTMRSSCCVIKEKSLDNPVEGG